MKAFCKISYILMITSIILASCYTLYKIPAFLGIDVSRIILFPTEDDAEAVQQAIGVSFPEGTKVKRIKCGYDFVDPRIFIIRIYMKLPQNDESKQFIESYYNIDKIPSVSKEKNEKSYNRNGTFVIKTTKTIKDSNLVDTLREMSQPIKPIIGTMWIIAIIFIVLYKKINKKYEMYYQKKMP